MKERAVRIYKYPEAIKLANHLAVCSRPWCCGNPRYSGYSDGGLTLQEKRFLSEPFTCD